MKANRKNTLLSASALLMFLFVMQMNVFAQNAIQFNELYNCPKSSLYYFKVLECENEKYCKVAFMTASDTQKVSFESEVSKSKIR